MSDLSQRAQAMSESVTMAVTAKAAQLRAAGKAVIGFGAGEPDFATPDHIVAAAEAACRDPKAHHYGPAAGMPALRASVAATVPAMNAEPTQVVVTNGAKQAVYQACSVLLDPGDEALIPAPYWVTYPEAVKLAGATPVAVPHGPDLKVTPATLEEYRTDKTKMLIFASPSNPTGVVYEAEEIAAIGRWAAEHGVWVLSDEIYEHLTYGGVEAVSMAAAAPEVLDYYVHVNGVSKTYAMTGWRVGWLIAPPAVAKAASSLQSHLSSNVANVSQMAALAALEGGLETAHVMREAFDRRRLRMVSMLRSTAGVQLVEPQGAFYAFPDVTELMEKKGISSSLDLATLLLDEIEVAAVPGDAFGAPGFLRFSFALSDENLEEGLTRLQEWAG
ncbi:MAG: pyridoxal phosphate-dependent aminotransferase [Acidimicrobiia bacterium]|nr:MAG: pyridoxal phosphate-dependent aminotransferase [Acidimicrobiia bacterium]